MCLSGQVWSWGDGDYGKLGRGGSDGCKSPKLVEKLQDLDIVKVCCGSQFSVALSKDGQVYTWGKGDNQRLGHGTDEHVRYPKLLDSLQGQASTTVPASTGGPNRSVYQTRGVMSVILPQMLEPWAFLLSKKKKTSSFLNR